MYSQLESELKQALYYGLIVERRTDISTIMPDAWFLKKQGHRGGFSLVKGTSMGIVKFDWNIEGAPRQWKGSTEAIASIPFMKYDKHVKINFSEIQISGDKKWYIFP